MERETILIINGPNLNLLGVREPHIYGDRRFEEYLAQELRPIHSSLQYYHSNTEGSLIDALQATLLSTSPVAGLIINAGAYTHTSIAIADTLRSIKLPSIEVHISNIYAREEYRRHSYLSEVCIGTIAGLGLDGYRLALLGLKSILKI